jgi:hypothetical protein
MVAHTILLQTSIHASIYIKSMICTLCFNRKLHNVKHTLTTTCLQNKCPIQNEDQEHIWKHNSENMNLYYFGSSWESGRLHQSHSLGIGEKQGRRADNQIGVPPVGAALVLLGISPTRPGFGARQTASTLHRSPTPGGQLSGKVG